MASKAERQDQRILVHQVLSEMPASSRSILVKSHIEGRSLSEIASELGISSNACSAMLYRARRTFRDRYVRSHVLPTDDEQCAAIRALMVDSTLAVGSEYEMVVADHRRECDDCESQYAFLLSPVALPPRPSFRAGLPPLLPVASSASLASVRCVRVAPVPLVLRSAPWQL